MRRPRRAGHHRIQCCLFTPNWLKALTQCARLTLDLSYAEENRSTRLKEWNLWFAINFYYTHVLPPAPPPAQPSGPLLPGKPSSSLSFVWEDPAGHLGFIGNKLYTLLGERTIGHHPLICSDRRWVGVWSEKVQKSTWGASTRYDIQQPQPTTQPSTRVAIKFERGRLP